MLVCVNFGDEILLGGGGGGGAMYNPGKIEVF